ncbi:mitogen-activated protein kinase kinase kinase 4-like isoform X2 [Paramacrobiotus metropolitanus]|uniref:mitogen-activated protein kinase kinase kinase 4-like isoform X2 n=1 Tax=Paramacrobiotus metropolitanus TaxID=2943436 RepID=UPI002445AED6|nr:mitogen-activated protein kinase kinase kinase 4-like isoform X2 [Paramacrobiotus metropolitanus]
MTVEVIGKTCSYEYEPGSFIGRGSNGTVYKAAITEHGNFAGSREVAVKVFRSFVSREQAYVSKMKINLELEHPHLVKYHKMTVFREIVRCSIELLMDYFPDGNLGGLLLRIQRGGRPLHPVKAISYAVDIAEVDSNERLLICDYDDSVQLRGNITVVGAIRHKGGYARYMSPEMVALAVRPESLKRPVGRKTDIWSLGCIFLQLAQFTVSTKPDWLVEKDGRVLYTLGSPDADMDPIDVGGPPCPHPWHARAFGSELTSVSDWTAGSELPSRSCAVDLHSSDSPIHYDGYCLSERFLDFTSVFSVLFFADVLLTMIDVFVPI